MVQQEKLFEILPASVRKKLRKQENPSWIAPMLATLVDEPFSREGWLFEPKFDGERCLAIRSGAEVALMSRNQKRLNEKYPELVDAFAAQRLDAFAVDGEIVAFDGNVTSFAKLQQRMQLRRPSAEIMRQVPVCFYAFDLLLAGGYDLRQLPLRERKNLLARALDFRDPLRFTEHRETEGDVYYKEACRNGWEGIVAKNADSTYRAERSPNWLKFKCLNEQEFVIGGYTEPHGERTGFGALLVGYYQSGKLKYAGKVGTGYDRETLRRLGGQLEKLETRDSPFAADRLPRLAHWVKPKLVAQIAFGEWTAAGKLRQPRFLGLRTDKAPKEVVREKKHA